MAISSVDGTAAAPAATPPDALREQRFPLALAYLCLSYLLGIYLASIVAPWQPVACLALLLCAGAWWRAGLPAALLALACIAALACGVWRADAAAYRDDSGQVAHYTGHVVMITGVVDGEPRAGGHGDNLPVQVRTLTVGNRAVHAGGQVLVYYTGPETVEYGDIVALRGQLAIPYSAPGFDYRAYLAGQGIHAVMSYPSLRLTGHGAGNPLEAFALRLRAALRRAIVTMLPHDEAALLIGILLGAPTRSLGALTDAFVAVGMIHVVAISGLKVALVAGMLSALCRPLPRRWRWPLPLLGVLLYTAVCAG
jgi:predicted membrane metal-binding protein